MDSQWPPLNKVCVANTRRRADTVEEKVPQSRERSHGFTQCPIWGPFMKSASSYWLSARCNPSSLFLKFIIWWREKTLTNMTQASVQFPLWQVLWMMYIVLWWDPRKGDFSFFEEIRESFSGSMIFALRTDGWVALTRSIREWRFPGRGISCARRETRTQVELTGHCSWSSEWGLPGVRWGCRHPQVRTRRMLWALGVLHSS